MYHFRENGWHLTSRDSNRAKVLRGRWHAGRRDSRRVDAEIFYQAVKSLTH